MATKTAAKGPKAGTQVSTNTNPGADGRMVLIQDTVPEHLKDALSQNRGSENVTTDDLVIPRLEVLQSISPQTTEGNPEYNPQAKPGDLINSVTGQIYGREVFAVPVFYRKEWLVWVARSKGGGFRGSFSNPQEAEDKAKAEGGKAAGIEVLDTPTHFVLLVNRETGGVEEVVMSMPRTKAKVSRAWNSMVKLAGGDRFSRVYRITTQVEKNAKGTFFNFVVAQSGFPAKVLYDKAEKLYTLIKSGRRKVVMDTSGLEPGERVDEESDM